MFWYNEFWIIILIILRIVYILGKSKHVIGLISDTFTAENRISYKNLIQRENVAKI